MCDTTDTQRNIIGLKNVKHWGVHVDSQIITCSLLLGRNLMTVAAESAWGQGLYVSPQKTLFLFEFKLILNVFEISKGIKRK